MTIAKTKDLTANRKEEGKKRLYNQVPFKTTIKHRAWKKVEFENLKLQDF